MFSQVTQIGSIHQLPPPVDSLQWCKIPTHDVNISSVAITQDEIDFDRLLPTLFECFAIVFCGFLAGRCNLISRSDIKGLNDFTTYFTLPPLIFLNLVTINFLNVNWYFVLGILLGKVLVFLLVAVVTAAVHRPLNLSYAGIYGIFCTQGNDFGLGYPIVASLYGSKRPLYPGYMYLIAPTSLLFTNPMGFFLMEAHKNRTSQDYDPKRSLFNTVLRTLGSVSWAVFRNPVVFVTLLGILGNYLFHGGLPSILYGILQILSSAFSASVLFLLGFSVVGSEGTKSSRKEGLLIPAALIIAKMVVSPLISRGTVALLCAGDTDVEDLADYGFLYGMVPTGPIVMLFAAEYCIKTEMMASTMVLCTALFGPVMFILARMLSLKVRGIEEFADELRTTMFVLSIISILCCLWIGLCFALSKKRKKQLYKITFCLVISQLIMAIGILMWSAVNVDGTWISFFEIAFIAAGQLMTRLWITLLALTLVINQKNPFSPFIKSMSWPIAIGFGIPAAAVLMLLVVTGIGQCHPELDKELPLFIYGTSEAVASIVVLTICLLITTFSLILFYRLRAHEIPYTEEKSVDISEVHPANSAISVTAEVQNDTKPAKNLLEGAGMAVYKLTNTLSDPSVVLESNGVTKCQTQDLSEKSPLGFEKTTKRSETTFSDKKMPPSANDEGNSESCHSLDILSVTSASHASDVTSVSFDCDDDGNHSHRHLRHVILLILSCISMAVGLTISTWKLSTNNPNGLFVALEFLDAVLNVGQGTFLFFVFLKKSKYILTPIGKWLRKVRRGFYSLDDPSDVTDDITTQLYHQFRTYHWENCMRDLPKTIISHQKSFKQCFTGKELVDWLIVVGLSNHRTGGELYGQRLVTGGILQSANGAVQFHDSSAYFYRLADNQKSS